MAKLEMDGADTPRRGSREIKTLIWVALGLYLLVSLFTYVVTDPGWSRLSGEPVVNGGGIVGAWTADLLQTLIGKMAFLLPAFCFLQVFWVWRSERPVLGWYWQWLAFVLAEAAGATVLSMRFPAFGPTDAPLGGVLGLDMATTMQASFGLAGSTVLLTAVFLITMTLATGMSWVGIMDMVGTYLWELGEKAMAGVSGAVGSRWQGMQEKRALKHEFMAAAEPTFKLDISNRKVKAQLTRSEPMLPVLDDIPHGAPVAEFEEPLRPVIVAPKPVKKPSERPPVEITPFIDEPKPGKRVQQEKQHNLFDSVPGVGDLPSLALLDPPETNRKRGYSVEALEGLSRLLELKLREFNIEAEVVAVHPGPVITRFEIQPAPGVKVARISNISKDLARSMAMISVRVVEVIPGKSVVGIEVPNEDREIVRLSEVLSSNEYDSKESPLTMALGKDIAGRPMVADLARMPHLLVAGTTGSGKSVGVNAMLISILYKARPEDVRLIMIDPKMLELSVYDKIPHLLTPVVTDMKDAANALRWCVGEMERRYKLMAAMGVRNLAGFNKKVIDAARAGEPIPDPLWRPQDTALQEEAPMLTKLPFVVVVIDEFADMMMVVGKKVEELIARIAQKARAAGIHLILATQRPSVDVITGLIKANIPTRIAFQVSSKIDSRTILDQGGADQLLGHGDMLYLPPGTSLPERVHGAFVSDEEVHRVCNDWRGRGEPDYIDEILEGSLEVTDGGKGGGNFGGFDDVGGDPEQDPLYDEAVQFVMETRRPSISFVQRKFKIGYNRAARLVEAMEHAGLVSAMQGNGQRDVIVPGRE
jgi:S-DNA-T family DNA segregation ATPase FtsK/SpoIIIE